MEKDAFIKFMHKKGKKPQRIKFFIDETLKFENYAKNKFGRNLDDAIPEDLESYAAIFQKVY